MTCISFNPDPNLPTPLYKQLSDSIETAIRKGHLKHGDRLPPTRQLSSDLKIARRTVVRAYDELLNKGYLTGKIGAGTTVSHIASEHFSLQPPAPPFERLGQESMHLSMYAKSLINHRITESENSEYEFNEDIVLQDLLPIRQWRQLITRNCQSDKLSLVDYDPYGAGYEPLRESLAEFLARTKGVICHPDQIIVFPNPQTAIEQLIKIVVDSGDRIIVEDPSSRYVYSRLRAHGAIIDAIGVDDHGLITDELGLKEIPKIAYLTPSCQYPTGTILSHERRVQILEWAQRNNVLIIEDASASDFRYGGQATASVQGLSPNNTVYVYGFHKMLSPLTSVAVLVVPLHMLTVIRAARSTVRLNTDLLESQVLTDFVNRGYLDAHIRKVRRVFQERRQLILYSLATCFWKAISISPRTSGMNVLVRFNHEFDEHIIAKCAQLADLPMRSTRANYIHAARGNEFLIPFSGLSHKELRQRLEKFASLVAAATDDKTDDQIDCTPCPVVRVDCSMTYSF